MDVIERLRHAVKESGFQRKKVAERAGMKAAKLTKILSGRQAVTVGDFIAIARAIDRDPSHLISEKDVVVELGELQSAHRAAQDIERILSSLLPKPAASRVAGAPLLPKRKAAAMVRPIRAAASSNVELLAEAEAKKVRIPRDAHARGASLVARAIGDSMEGPGGIRDRQLVFLRPTRSRRTATGKIVVCRVDDAIYLKQLTGTGRGATLVSINRAHEPIEIDDANRMQIYGIVVWPATL
ncbi:MAG TPA: LexA family transcriptional regulator [Thermoanaerobaculia bacterium]|jgi:SOS-response transcriptional repressor LexA